MSAALDAWGREIERHSGGRIVVVPVETNTTDNTITIPPEFPGRPIVRDLLLDEPFVRQFTAAHALTVNHLPGRLHFILLNQARASDWGGLDPEPLLAHEYGHIWLQALGYRSPDADGTCVPTHAGDIVQHVLIRDETRRRGFAYDAFWKANQERWLDAATGPLPLDSCGRLQLLSAWLDASLGYSERTWPRRAAFLEYLDRNYASLLPVQRELHDLLGALDLKDRSRYEYSLRVTLRICRAHDTFVKAP